jgi:HK97 family phage major capsid protein
MHRDSDFLPARGIQFARLAIATAAGQYTEERLAYAQRRWGSRSSVVQMLKADVGGHEIGDTDFLSAGTFEQAAEFGELVDSQGLLKSGLTPVPANVPFIGAVTDPTASWVGQSKAIPLSRAVLDRSTLQSKKIASLLVLTQELINSSDPRTEMLVLNMMLRAARLAADAAISDPLNTGDAATPASITSEATPIASSGDLADDAEAALSAYAGSLESAVWWMRADLAAQAGIRSGAFGAGAGLGALGGVLGGLPVYTSEAIPADSSGSPLILLDRASVAMVDEGYSVVRSTAGTVEMTDTPAGATDTPVTMSTSKFVSLFQADAVGLLLVRRVNWHLANPAAVVVISDCNYSAAA